jgi:hypothetical protein
MPATYYYNDPINGATPIFAEEVGGEMLQGVVLIDSGGLPLAYDPVDGLTVMFTNPSISLGSGGEAIGFVAIDQTTHGNTNRVYIDPTDPIAISNFPAGLATEATIGSLLVQGSAITGAAMPAGGAGAFGWLSAIAKALWDRLPAALTAGGNLKVALQESGVTQAVSAGAAAPVFVRLSSGAVAVDTIPVSAAGVISNQHTSFSFDYDTTGATVNLSMFGMALPSATGPVPVGTANPMPISDNGGIITVDGTVAMTTAAAAQADGHSASIGATADADTASTVIGRLKKLVTLLAAGLPAAFTAGGGVKAGLVDAIPAGANLVGKFGIDQTTPGATNKVSIGTDGIVDADVPASAALKMTTGSLVTTATTANQVVATYTVTAGKTFMLEYWDMNSRLTTFATTATLMGTWSLQVNGVTVYTGQMTAAGARFPDQVLLPKPVPVAAGIVVRLVVTPAAATSMTWQGNFGGYEK